MYLNKYTNVNLQVLSCYCNNFCIINAYSLSTQPYSFCDCFFFIFTLTFGVAKSFTIIETSGTDVSVDDTPSFICL